MNIAFCSLNRHWGGLSNTGGSRTILLSCEALQRLGHKAVVVARHDKFTWWKHQRPSKKIPADADALVAIAITDIAKLMKKANGKTMAYWARPVETWQMSWNKAILQLKLFEAAGGKIFVNSGWQNYALSAHGLDPAIIWAGMDFAKWENKRITTPERRRTLAVQYSDKPRKGYKQFTRLRLILKDRMYRYLAFGSRNSKDGFSYYVKNATATQLAGLYNRAQYFVVPNKHEGWYNAAAQAALCGCTLVLRDVLSNGCSDFATVHNSIVYTDPHNAAQRIRNGEIGDNTDVVRRLKDIGTREQCMGRMVAELQK